MDAFKRLLRLAKPYKLRLAIAMICMMLAGAAQSSIALLFKPLLDGLFLKKDSYALDPNTLKWVLPLANHSFASDDFWPPEVTPVIWP